MADTKISLLTDGSPLQASDDILVARGSANYRVRINLASSLGSDVLHGLETARNGTTAIDIAPGKSTVTDGTDWFTASLASTLNKTQAAWVVGNGVGGLDTGTTYTVSTWYYVWLIQRSDTGVTDVLLSASKTTPTMPANYDRKRMIAAVYVNAGGTIDDYLQSGDIFHWQPDIKTVLDTTAPATTFTLLSMGAACPPIHGALARVSAILRNTGDTAKSLALSDGITSTPTTTANAHQVFNYYQNSVIAAPDVSARIDLAVDGSGNIKYAANTATAVRTIIKCSGFVMARGRE